MMNLDTQENYNMSDTIEAIDPITAVMVAEGVFEADYDEQVQAWQYLHDSGLAYQLQGWFGRQAQHLIDTGVIQG
jgi:hypothetical protein